MHGPSYHSGVRWPERKIAILLLMLLAVVGCSAPVPNRSGSADQAGAARVEPARKRIVAAIRGMPSSMVQQRTQPPGLAGSVPGLDALQELVHAGLTHYDG